MQHHRCRLGLWLALVAVAAWAQPTSGAEGVEPRVFQLAPQGGQRGTEVTVRIKGQRLSGRGVAGKDTQNKDTQNKVTQGQAGGDADTGEPLGLLLHGPGLEVLELKPDGSKAVEARLRIADDCPLGAHALRVRTPRGLSDLVTFHVGAFPETNEAEPNNSPEEPQAIALGAVVNGRVDREDSDWFAVDVDAGQRLSIEVEGLRLGRVMFDPTLELYGPRRGPGGGLIAEADDSRPTYQDPRLSITAAEGGRYLIRVRESAMRGDGKSTYRLHVGRFALPDSVFPPVMSTAEPELSYAPCHSGGGAEVDADAVLSQPLWLPGPGTTADYFACDPGLAHFEQQGEAGPTGTRLLRTNLPVATEAEPNDVAAEATKVDLPAAMAGVVGEPGDRDYFSFSGKKGQTFHFRVAARRLRSPLDPVLRVFKNNGKHRQGNDDDAGHPDSYLRYRVPEDGEYVVQIDDHQQRGGPGYVYAVEAARVEPAVQLTLQDRRRFEEARVVAPRGNRFAVLLNARREEFGDAIRPVFDGLPDGVTADAATIKAGATRVPVVFRVEADAPLAGALIGVGAERLNGQPLRTRFYQQSWAVRSGPANTPMWGHFARRAPLAVAEPAPFTIRLVEPKAPLVQDGSMNLRVVAERSPRGEGQADQKDANAAIRVRMLYHPPGLSSNSSRSVPQGKSSAAIPVTANGNAKVGEWPIVVTGEANVGGRLLVSTQIVTLRVAAPHLALSLPKATLLRGSSTDYAVAIERQAEFAGTAKLTLLGLPPGVSAEPVEVDHDATSAVFRVIAAENGRVGRHRSVACRVELSVAGEPVVHTKRGGELLVDPAPKPRADRRTADRRSTTKQGAS